MKKLNFLALFTFAAVILSSCGGLNKMQEMASDVSYDVTPEVLEEQGDQVDVKIDVRYPEKYFNKNAILTVTPVLKYADGETAFESKTLQGEKVEANNQVVSFDGGSISYSGTVPFNEEMMKSDLVIRASAELKGNSLDFEDYKIADGVIATSELVKVDPKPVMVGDKFQRIIPESYVADIHYIINRYNVRNSELDDEDISGMEEFLEKAKGDERIKLKGIDLSAYASPDGPIDFNDRLAQDRQGSAERYLSRELSRKEIEQAKEEGFVSKSYTKEDWEGFKELMQESDIQDKELILRVLSMYSDPVVREREIKNISQAFEEIADKVLPKLRRSKFSVNVDKIGLSDDELLSVWNSDPDSLNLEELLYTATLVEDNETKLAVYKEAADEHPNCFRAINNVGYIYVMMGEADEAEQAFEEAKDIMDNDIVNNNLGVTALMQGNVEEAEGLFTSSMGAGNAANYNLGIVKIIQGDYDAAANYFGSMTEYNNALLKVLQDDFQGANAMLNKLDDSAKVDYLKAVVAAYQDQDDAVFNNLRAAFSKDADLKERAKVDVVFADYFENDTFQGLVE